MNSKLLYSDITYKIRGACFSLRKELGWGHKEVIYQRGLLEKLQNLGLKVEREKRFPVKVDGKTVGYYVPDLVIEDKVMMEIKAKEALTKQDLKQFWHYLRTTPYKLGLLVNFGNQKELQIRRVIYDKARNIQR